MAKKNILFVHPKNRMNQGFWMNSILKRIAGRFLPVESIPLSLIYLGSMTPKSYDRKFITLSPKSLEKVNEKSDLVCITISTCDSKAGYKIADYFRKKGISVVLGGFHASMLPEEAEMHADSVVIGEAEGVWRKVLDDFEKGELKKKYQAEECSKWIEGPKKRLVSKKFGVYNICLESTRGCPRNCTFCAVTSLYGPKIRHRKIKELVREIKSIRKRSNFFFFIDDNIIIDKVYARKLFKALIPLKIKWFCQADISIAKDKELLELAYQSGCRFVFIGFESVSQRSLDEMNKGTKFKEYIELIKKIKDKGIFIVGSFVYGFDSDDKDSIKNTIKFCKKTKIDLPVFSILIPYPGTQLYNKLKQENRITNDNWEEYSKQVVFRMKKFKKGELERGILKSHKTFYSFPGIFKKAWNYWRSRKFSFSDVMAFSALYLTIYIYNYYRCKSIYRRKKII